LSNHVRPFGDDFTKVSEALVEVAGDDARPDPVVEVRLRRQHSGNLRVSLHEVLAVVVYLLNLPYWELDTGEFELLFPDGRDGGGGEDTLDDDEQVLINDEVQPLSPARRICRNGQRNGRVVAWGCRYDGAPLAPRTLREDDGSIGCNIRPECAPTNLVARWVETVAAVGVVEAPDVLGPRNGVIPRLRDSVVGAGVYQTHIPHGFFTFRTI